MRHQLDTLERVAGSFGGQFRERVVAAFTAFWKRVPPSAPGQTWFLAFVGRHVHWRDSIGPCAVDAATLTSWLTRLVALLAHLQPETQVRMHVLFCSMLPLCVTPRTARHRPHR